MTTNGAAKDTPYRVVLTMNGNGVGGDEQHPDTLIIGRDTTVYKDGPPDINNPPGTYAQMAAYWCPQLHEAMKTWGADYYVITNELGGSWEYEDNKTPEENEAARAEVIQHIKNHIAYEKECVKFFQEIYGMKSAVCKLANGNPSPDAWWREYYAPFILWAWGYNQSIYARHCYGGGDLVDEAGNISTHQPNNPSRIIDELEYLKSLGWNGGMVLAECGLDGGYGVADWNRFYFQVTKFEQALRPHADNIIGFCWWECGADTGWDADYTEYLKQMTPYIEQNSIPKWEAPTAVIPPIEPPIVEPSNIMKVNFTGWGVQDNQEPVGWYDSEDCPNIQVPMAIKDSGRVPLVYEKFSGDNPFNPDGESWNDYSCPEGVVLWDDLLPPNEHYFLNELGRCYHWFCPQTAGRSRYGRFESLAVGTYRLTLVFIGDFAVMVDGQKEPQGDPQHGQVELFVGTQGRDDFIDIALLGNNTIVREFEITVAGEYFVGYGMLSRYAAGSNGTAGMFVQGFGVDTLGEAIEPPIEPPTETECPWNMPDVRRQTWLIPQDSTHEEIAEIWAEFTLNKSTITFSHDDGGIIPAHGDNGRSDVVVFNPERWDFDILAWYAERGVNTTVRYFSSTQPEVFSFVSWPTPHRVVTQEFLANPQLYTQFGLPGHDGVDIRAYHGDAVYAVANGVISDIHFVDDGHNYGIFIRVSHADNYETTYAHLKETIRAVGETVTAGTIIGLADNTGNSSGSHLHLTLKKKGETFTDRCGNTWPSNICDPTPFMFHFSGVTWPGGSPGFPCPGEPVEPEPPPAGSKIDLLPYIKGDGRLYEVRNSSGGQERFQTQTQGDRFEFWQTKNGMAEQLFWDNYHIQRGWDLSPGAGRYYQQQQPKGNDYANWLPRMMAVSEAFTVSLHVQFYDWNCQPSAENSGNVMDTRRFVEHLDSWTSPYGITIKDIVVIEWVNGGEFYYYARDFGLVGWGRTHDDPNTPLSSGISEIHAPGQRPDNIVDLPDCLA